ncbi:PHB depolymerase family esterase [Bordetella sp. H567]|uniref:PHB depolymerase family esterase n=1 Tax=Bordetella sp. H567 TaxID=1697043 RepID=UPI001314D1AA|nr:PHB depolymerase family esterase [Bordetella sp. H567]
MKTVTYGLGILFLAASSLMPSYLNVAWGQQAAGPRDAAASAPAPINVDTSRIAVAGFSSGAYMAVQAQIAFPKMFRRAGILAGGPYECAEGSVAAMIKRCMEGAPSQADVKRFVQTTIRRSNNREVGPLTELSNGIVYLLHGTADVIVKPPVAEATMAYYTELKQQAGLANLTIIDDNSRDFGHTFPTDLPSAPVWGQPYSKDDCKTSALPYIGHCKFDGAKLILTHLYPEIDSSQVVRTGAAGKLRQVPVSGAAGSAYMEDWAYLYTPASCLDGQRCGLLVALHGCGQNYTSIGDNFVRLAGFNRWADAFHVAVLYPQTKTFFGNYGGCWDWWGYTDANYDVRKSQQLQRITGTVMDWILNHK